jgi:hypothetical protein
MESYDKRKRYESDAGGGKKKKCATDDVAKGQNGITDNNGIISGGGELQASTGTSPNVPPGFLEQTQHLLRGPVTKGMISYLANMFTRVVIQCKPTLTAGKTNVPYLTQFITGIVICSNVKVPTLMTSLLYLARLEKKLPQAKGLDSTRC